MSILRWGLIGAAALILGSSALLLVYFLISWIAEWVVLSLWSLAVRHRPTAFLAWDSVWKSAA